MTEEQRAALRATAQAGGQSSFGSGEGGRGLGFGGTLGPARLLLDPLIQMLSERAQ